MNKNTSITLGNHFDSFVQNSISSGRYKNVSEVVRAGLRLLEEEESKLIALRQAIQEGTESGIANDFDPQKHLESLKTQKRIMANFYLTNKAVKDLANIWNYTFDTWTENQADKYYQTLLENCQKIAENPKIGKAYYNVEKSLLGLHVNKHIIFYRKISEDFIEITRILHEMMDLKSQITEQ